MEKPPASFYGIPQDTISKTILSNTIFLVVAQTKTQSIIHLTSFLPRVLLSHPLTP